MSLSDLTEDTQAAVEKLFDFAEQKFGVTPSINSTLRSCAEQNALFAKGRSTPGNIVTNAKGCVSWHVLGRAVDIFVPGFTKTEYEQLGRFWESMGGFWGGRIKGLDDFGHFEWHPGVRIEEVCTNPDACSAAVASSYDLFLAPPRGVGGNGLQIVLIAGAVLGAWAFADYFTRRSGGYGKFRWI